MNLWNLCILRFGFAVSSIRLGASAVMLARLDPGIVCSLITGPPVVWTLFLSRSFCTLECLFAIMRHLSIATYMNFPVMTALSSLDSVDFRPSSFCSRSWRRTRGVQMLGEPGKVFQETYVPQLTSNQNPKTPKPQNHSHLAKLRLSEECSAWCMMSWKARSGEESWGYIIYTKKHYFSSNGCKPPAWTGAPLGISLDDMNSHSSTFCSGPQNCFYTLSFSMNLRFAAVPTFRSSSFPHSCFAVTRMTTMRRNKVEDLEHILSTDLPPEYKWGFQTTDVHTGCEHDIFESFHIV